jgi:hypothetical protein
MPPAVNESRMTSREPFYVRHGERYEPSQSTEGPWDPRLQHGGPVAALLATRIEAAAARADGRVAQFALEFLGPVPRAPLEVATSVVRPGKKIALWQATGSHEGRPLVIARAWILATSAGRSPLFHLLDTPPPAIPETAIDSYFASVPHFGYGDALEWRFTEGGFNRLGPAAVWTRLRVAIVAGEPVSPLARVLAMVDSANGISAELDPTAHLFVPVNLSIALARLPDTEWTGMRAVTSMADDGVGVTRAELYDERGNIGEALQALYVEKR